MAARGQVRTSPNICRTASLTAPTYRRVYPGPLIDARTESAESARNYRPSLRVEPEYVARMLPAVSARQQCGNAPGRFRGRKRFIWEAFRLDSALRGHVQTCPKSCGNVSVSAPSFAESANTRCSTRGLSPLNPRGTVAYFPVMSKDAARRQERSICEGSLR